MERFWKKVNKTQTCWLWTGATTKPIPKGYGRIRVAGKLWVAHKYLWESINGSIPEGFELDHRCKTKHCVRPDHLEVVTHAVNCQRSPGGRPPATKCKQGHEYAGTNVYIRPNGYRDCVACRNQRARDRRRLGS